MGLIPLCYMHFTARVNSEAVNTIRNLRNCGVNLRGFSPGDASRATRILESAGINQESLAGTNSISGLDLIGLDRDALYRAAKIYYGIGKYKKDQKYFTDTINLETRIRIYYYYLGDTLFKKSRYELAYY